MRKILITAIVILFTISVNAQIMPQELTCTEKAFNFSFSLGTNWKFSTPKMGPVDVINNEPYYNPAWALKVNDVTPETRSPSLLSAGAAGYAINQQNYVPFYYPNSLKVMDKLKNPFTAINFSPATINYTLLKPGLTAVQSL